MTVFLVAAVLVTAVGAWTDWRTGHIPNAVTFGALGVAPVAHVVAVLVQHGAKVDAFLAGAYSILGAFLCALLPSLFYRLNAIGGGDLKIFVALGALLLPLLGGEVQIWSFFAAGLIAPFLLAYQGKLFKTVKNAAFIVANPFIGKASRRELSAEDMSWFRMGPAILLATVYVTVEHWRD